MYFKVNEKNEREDGFYCKIQVLPNNFKIGDEGIVFEDVPCIKKFNKKSKKKKCEWFNLHQCDCKPLRMFDCQKKLETLQTIYIWVTGIIFILSTIFIFFVYDKNILKGFGYMLLIFIAMDIVCCLIEIIIPFLRDKFFYRKLMRIKGKKEKIKPKEEEFQKTKKVKKIFETTYSGKVILAEEFVKKIRKVLDENDFGCNNRKIDECVNRLEEIIEILKKDSSNYPRVAFLFEVYLPKFYDILMQYLAFIDADCEKEQVKKILSDFMEKFIEYLKTQKIESRLGKDKNQALIEFQSLAETVQSNLKKGEQL